MMERRGEGRHRVLRYAVRRLQGERRAYRQGGRRASDSEPRRGWIPALLLALAVAVLDWGVKAYVASRVPLEGFVEIMDDRVALWHVRNDAMILGLYGNLPLEYRKGIAAICGVLGAILLVEVVSRGHRFPPRRRWCVWIFVGLSFGGMLGNLGERVVHWGVTDYLSLHWNGLWLPPGNVADLAIFLSIPMAFLVIVFELLARMERNDDVAVEAEESFAGGGTAATAGS